MVSEAIDASTIRLQPLASDSRDLSFSSQSIVDLPITHACTIHAVAFWFKMSMRLDGVACPLVYEISTGEAGSHWRQAAFVLEAIEVRRLPCVLRLLLCVDEITGVFCRPLGLIAE